LKPDAAVPMKLPPGMSATLKQLTAIIKTVGIYYLTLFDFLIF
jgi:hypothetical protein